MIPVGFAGASSSYSITNSARFDGSTTYLARTPGSAGNGKKFTISLWTKRSALARQFLLGANGSNPTGLTFNSDHTLQWQWSGNAVQFGAAVYRDPSAWMHIVIAWDTTQATAADRVKCWINGASVAHSGATLPSLNYDETAWNANGIAHTIAAYPAPGLLYGGYLSDVYNIDGQALTPTSFGKTDSNGVWVPIKYAGTYGTNGFKLAFGSSGALGADTSGNGNTWTVSGSPVQTTDTPSINCTTLNPLEPGSGTYSSGNTAVSLSSYNYQGFGSIPMTSGKWYWEITSTGGTQVLAGICDPRVVRGSDPWTSAYIWGYRDDTGGIRHNSTNTAYGNSYTTEVIGVAFDANNGRLYFAKSNTWQNSAVPASGTGGFTADIVAGTGYLPWFGSQVNVTRSWSVNFGATAFAYTPPTGFNALCTANLTSTAVTTSGTFTGNSNADGPFIWTNGNPATLTINGNAVTFGTHADKTAGGFKLRSSSASYNTSGSNTWTATAGKRFVYSATSINTAQGNP